MYLAALLNKIISSSLKIPNNLRDAMDISVCLWVCRFFNFIISHSGYVVSSDWLRASTQSERLWRQLVMAFLIVSTQNFLRAIVKKKKKGKASVRIGSVHIEVRTRNIPNTIQFLTSWANVVDLQMWYKNITNLVLLYINSGQPKM